MILQYFRLLICLIIHSFICIIPHKRSKIYDVVIVRSDAIGDFVIWLSALDCYKNKYNGKKILLICPSVNEGIAKCTNCFTEILTFDRKKIIDNIFYHARYMWMLKSISSSIVINPAWGHQFSADFICAMIKSSQKIGSSVKREITVKNKLDKFFSKLIDIGIGNFGDLYFSKLVPMPHIKNTSEFEAIESFTQQVIDPSFKYRLADLAFITKGYVSDISNKYCFVSVSSSRVLKDWPIDRLSELLKCVPNDYSIVLSGIGTVDLKKAKYLIDEDSGQHRMINCINKTSVIDMICLISKSSFVIGYDSAAVHISAACRVPSLCIIHGAHFARFVPYPSFIPEQKFHPICVYRKMDCYGCGYQCNNDFDINKPFYCLRQVTVDMAKIKLKILIDSIET